MPRATRSCAVSRIAHCDEFIEAFEKRLRHDRRRARRAAVGRPAPARGHRARDSGRPAHPDSRRGDLEPRQRERGADPGRPASRCGRAARRSSSRTGCRRSAAPTRSWSSKHGEIVERGTHDELLATRRPLPAAVRQAVPVRDAIGSSIPAKTSRRSPRRSWPPLSRAPRSDDNQIVPYRPAPFSITSPCSRALPRNSPPGRRAVALIHTSPAADPGTRTCLFAAPVAAPARFHCFDNSSRSRPPGRTARFFALASTMARMMRFAGANDTLGDTFNVIGSSRRAAAAMARLGQRRPRTHARDVIVSPSQPVVAKLAGNHDTSGRFRRRLLGPPGRWLQVMDQSRSL